MDNKVRDRHLLRITEQTLRLKTLETSNHDATDFHETAVWTLRAALQAAYKAGYQHADEDAERRLTE